MMTGRRLYDLLCDAWSEQNQWDRKSESNTTLPVKPLAWPFLTYSERQAFSRAATRLKGVKR